MKLRSAAKKVFSETRQLVFPTFKQSERALAADAAAQSVWAEVFAPLAPMTVDADILEVGCHDGRLLQNRIAEGARSAVGLSRVAYWRGEGGGAKLSPQARSDRLELHDDFSYLDAFDPASFDLVLCRDLEAAFPLEGVEAGVRRLYDLVRPGGEALMRVGCPDLPPPPPAGGAAAGGPGYGFLTPTSWTMLFMRAGFEIGEIRRVWRSHEAAGTAARILPLASDDERMTAEMRCRLVRPWESWELDRVWAA